MPKQKPMSPPPGGSRSPRQYMARNRIINTVRKRTKHPDMGIYAKRRSPATKPRKA